MGTLPNFTSPNLYYLDVSGNNLSGSLDATRWEDLRNLKYLSLNDNQLTGTIPSSIGTAAPFLNFADFTDNELTGSMPVEICNLTPDPLEFLQADCLSVNGNPPQLFCSCCTFCSV